MESIRIKNFRSLRDTGKIDIKPITILVGKNSSGKSSFLRSFPLFKQTFEERTSAPILLYRRNGIDFGSYNDIKPISSGKNDYLEYEFNFSSLIKPHLKRSRRLRGKVRIKDTLDCSISIKIDSNSEGSPVLNGFTVSVYDKVISFNIDHESRKLSSLKVDNQPFLLKSDFKIAFRNGLLPDRLHVEDNEDLYDLEDYCLEELKRIIKRMNHGKVSNHSIESLIEKFSKIESKEEILNTIKSTKGSYKKWGESVERLDRNPKIFEKIYDLIILSNIESLLFDINRLTRDTFLQVRYIAPVRATAERYYRIQDLSVSEVDPYGQNLAMFLGSLPSSQLIKFQKWTEENFKFKTKIKKIEGHYSIKIEFRNKQDFNISDMGFGYSQILPIITQLWHSSLIQNNSRNRILSKRAPIIFVIEQPELHLHPDFQAQFSDTICKIISTLEDENSIKIIIETHSQTIINRLGENIVEEKITEDDVNVVIFNKDDIDSPTSIKISNYDEDGLLNNWPIGFFKPESL